jgi:hypothetical protein
MFSVEGRCFKTLVLGGGGTPHFEVLYAFLRSSNVSLNELHNIISVSAGSMVMLVRLMQEHCCITDEACRLLLETCVGRMQEAARSMWQCVEHEESAFLASEDIRAILEDLLPEPMQKLTFGDLSRIFPSLDWKVLASVRTETRFHPVTFGAHTPKVKVWEACVASSALPVVTSGFSIDGIRYFDGDCARWSDLMPEDWYCIGCQPLVVLLSETLRETSVPFIDEMMHSVFSYVRTQLDGIHDRYPERCHLTCFPTQLGSLGNNCYEEAGKRLATKVILKPSG